MTCKNCKHGKTCKYGTVNCRLLERVLIVDRAENCKDYELKTEIKRYNERMKARNEV